MDNILQNLLNAFGVSGHESKVREAIKTSITNKKCEIKEDKMGNLIVKIGSGKEKLMLCAHMDEIGVIATYIEDNGFVRIGSVGDFKAEDVLHKFVKFEGGILGKIASSKGNPDISDLFVDLGLSKKDEVKKNLREGDVGCFLSDAIEVEDNIIAPNLDNRIGCYILIRLINEIEETDKELYFVFSTQQELGGRGARAAAYSIMPDYCLVLDMEEANDIIGGNGNIGLKNGPVISVMDKTLIMHHEIKELLEKAASEGNIEVQYTISKSITDGGTIHKEGAGIKTGTVLVPCRYKHTTSEMVSLKTVESTIDLLKRTI